mgnify:CR=1 FL=1
MMSMLREAFQLHSILYFEWLFLLLYLYKKIGYAINTLYLYFPIDMLPFAFDPSKLLPRSLYLVCSTHRFRLFTTNSRNRNFHLPHSSCKLLFHCYRHTEVVHLVKTLSSLKSRLSQNKLFSFLKLNYK